MDAAKTDIRSWEEMAPEWWHWHHFTSTVKVIAVSGRAKACGENSRIQAVLPEQWLVTRLIAGTSL